MFSQPPHTHTKSLGPAIAVKMLQLAPQIPIESYHNDQPNSVCIPSVGCYVDQAPSAALTLGWSATTWNFKAVSLWLTMLTDTSLRAQRPIFIEARHHTQPLFHCRIPSWCEYIEQALAVVMIICWSATACILKAISHWLTTFPEASLRANHQVAAWSSLAWRQWQLRVFTSTLAKIVHISY